MIRPYSALTTGAGDSSCPFTLWAAFENIRLTGPTVTQSSIVSQKELKGKDKPVSGALMKVSKASTILGEIPMLSPVMSQVSWATSVLSRAASALGWSKPMLRSAPVYTRERTAPYFHNVDQPSTAMNLGSTSDSSTALNPPCNLSNLDEMSIDYVKKIPAWFATVSWGAQTAGSTLTYYAIYPALGRQLTGLVTTNTPWAIVTGKQIGRAHV